MTLCRRGCRPNTYARKWSRHAFLRSCTASSPAELRFRPGAQRNGERAVREEGRQTLVAPTGREASGAGAFSTVTGEPKACSLSFANTAADDYRIAGERGVDWAPAEVHFGP